MRALVFATSLVLLLAACHRKDRFDRVLDDLQGYRDRMCACVDLACADRVAAEVRGYQDSMAERTGGGSATDEQERAGRKLQGEIRDCRKQLAPKPAPP